MTRTTIAALLATAAPTLALAQAAAPGPAPAPAATPAPIEEIVVTAQLRRETLQAVPLAVTAISGAALSRENIENFADLAKITPGFTAGAAYGFIRNSSMRGISNNQFGFADDPSIAIFTDGVYQGRGGTGSIVNALYDVDRVEILKGPQATLFGRSSIGGAINTILNQPVKGVTEGNAEIGLGERDRAVARGALNLPLADALTLRVAGDYEAEDGYIANRNGGRALQPLEVGAARVALRYEAGPLDVTLRGGFERRRQSGAVYQAVGLPKFVADSNLRGREAYSNFDIYDGVLRARYAFAPGVSLTSTTSYRSVANRYVEDYDATSTIVGGPYSQQSRDDLFQQDVILNVDKGRFSLVAGGSYFDEWLKGGVQNYVNETFAFTGAPDEGLAPNDYSLALYEAGQLRGRFHGYSFFGDASFEVVRGLKLTGGVRYNYDSKTYTQTIFDPATLPQSALIFPGAFYNWGYYTSTPITSRKSWTDVSFRAAADYTVARDLNVYASFNQGWKAGGIDSFKVQTDVDFPLFLGLDAAAAPYNAKPNVYNPENSDSYEIGAKGRFLDRRLSVNVALYDYEYRNLQVSIPQGGSSIIANVGSARGRGVEVETRLVPVPWLDLFANAAYNDTRINSFPQKPEQVGQPLNQAPRWTAAGGGTATLPLGERVGTLALGGTLSYRSRYRNDNALFEGVKPYTLTDLRATLTDPSKRYSIEVFCDNVFDIESYSRYNAATPFLFPVASKSVIGPPRTIGVNLRARFGGR